MQSGQKLNTVNLAKSNGVVRMNKTPFIVQYIVEDDLTATGADLGFKLNYIQTGCNS